MTRAKPTAMPIMPEAITPGPFRLKDIVWHIPWVELNPGFATDVPDACNRGMRGRKARSEGEMRITIMMIRQQYVLVVNICPDWHM